MAADHTGEAVECQHSALSGAASCDDIIACAGIQQSSCKDAVLHICELCLVIRRVHAVVLNFKSHGLHNFAEGLLNDPVLSQPWLFP